MHGETFTLTANGATVADIIAGVPVLLPNQDLTVTEATIVRWLKKVGEQVTMGEPVVEVETAKSVFPVESPAAGVLAETLAVEGATIAMTQRLGTIQPLSN